MNPFSMNIKILTLLVSESSPFNHFIQPFQIILIKQDFPREALIMSNKLTIGERPNNINIETLYLRLCRGN